MASNAPYFRVRPMARFYQNQYRHVAAASAYQARTRLTWKDRVFDFSERSADLVEARILLPPSTPSTFMCRQHLCDALQRATNFKDGLMGYWLVASYPSGTPENDMKQIAKQYCDHAFVAQGLCADFAVHSPQQAGINSLPHMHAIISTHEISPKGFGTYRKDMKYSCVAKAWHTAWQKLTS